MFANNKAKEQEIQAAFNATSITSNPFGERKAFNMEQANAKNVARDPVITTLPDSKGGQQTFKTANHSRAGSLGEQAYKTAQNFQKAMPHNKISKKNKEDAENGDQVMSEAVPAVPSKMKGIEEEQKPNSKVDVRRSAEKEPSQE